MNYELNRQLTALRLRLESAKTANAPKDPAIALRRKVGMALRWLQAGALTGAAEELAGALKLSPSSAELTALLKSAHKKVGGVNPRSADADVEKALKLLGVKPKEA